MVKLSTIILYTEVVVGFVWVCVAHMLLSAITTKTTTKARRMSDIIYEFQTTYTHH